MSKNFNFVTGSQVMSLINKAKLTVGENGTLLNEEGEAVEELILNDATKASYKYLKNPETVVSGYGVIGGQLVADGQPVFAGTRTFVDGICIAVPGMFVYVLATCDDGGYDILSYDVVQGEFSRAGYVPNLPEKAGINPDGFEVWVYTQTHEVKDENDDKAEPKVIFDDAGFIVFAGFGKVFVDHVCQPLIADAVTDGFRLYIATDSYVDFGDEEYYDDDDDEDDDYDDCDGPLCGTKEVIKGDYSYILFGRHGQRIGRIVTGGKAVSVTRNNALRGSVIKTATGIYLLDETGRQALKPGAEIMAFLTDYDYLVAADEDGYIFATETGLTKHLSVKRDSVLGTTYSLE